MTVHMIFMSLFGICTLVSFDSALKNYRNARGKKCLLALAAGVFFASQVYLNWWAQVHG